MRLTVIDRFPLASAFEEHGHHRKSPGNESALCMFVWAEPDHAVNIRFCKYLCKGFIDNPDVRSSKTRHVFFELIGDSLDLEIPARFIHYQEG